MQSNGSQQCKTCKRKLAIAEDKKRVGFGWVAYMAPPKVKDKCDVYIGG